MGDALFVDNIYYLESAENLQLTLRCKNSKIGLMYLDHLGTVGIVDSADSEMSPFKFYLKVSSVNTDADAKIDETDENNTSPDYILLETVNESSFGKDKDRYRYFVLSFDDVKIEYAKSKVELYVLKYSIDGETVFDENESVGRFTLFDINMPKTKIQAKKFKLD